VSTVLQSLSTAKGMNGYDLCCYNYSMKNPIEGEHWYFVDETGDPVFYDERGNLIVGTEGCSPILGIGFIETDEPSEIRHAQKWETTA